MNEAITAFIQEMRESYVEFNNLNQSNSKDKFSIFNTKHNLNLSIYWLN